MIINLGRNKIYHKLCKFLNFFYKIAYTKNEAISLVVAECIGKLVAVDIQKHAISITKKMADQSPQCRRTMAASLKYLITSETIDVAEFVLLKPFIKLLKDEDL